MAGHCARFVAVSVENSAARTAALIVAQRAAVAAVASGCHRQRAVGLFLRAGLHPAGRGRALPAALLRAGLAALAPGAASIRATGVALWASAGLIDDAQQADEPQAGRAATVGRGPPRILFKASELKLGAAQQRAAVQRIRRRARRCGQDRLAHGRDRDPARCRDGAPLAALSRRSLAHRPPV